MKKVVYTKSHARPVTNHM